MTPTGLLRGWQHRRRGDVTLACLPPLEGRVALVTGASGGLGLACTRELARGGALVYMACRSKEKFLEAADLIRQEVYPGAFVSFLRSTPNILAGHHPRFFQCASSSRRVNPRTIAQVFLPLSLDPALAGANSQACFSGL